MRGRIPPPSTHLVVCLVLTTLLFDGVAAEFYIGEYKTASSSDNSLTSSRSEDTNPTFQPTREYKKILPFSLTILHSRSPKNREKGVPINPGKMRDDAVGS